MLIEDIGLRVMPLGRRWTERDFSVELVPPSERFEGLIADGLKPEGYEGLTEGVCDFMRESAQIAMQYGRAIYEIVYLTDDRGDVASLEFAYVPPNSIDEEGDAFIQHVPQEISVGRELPAEIRIARRDLMIFEPPLEPARIVRMLEALAEVSRPDLPEFVQQEMQGEASVSYSATEGIRFQDLAVAEVSREIGWDARSGLTGKETFLEYYVVVRRLRFERFLARFRQSLLEQLNSYLSVIGEALGENGQLVITGMPTEADVDAAEDHLKRGDSDFGELLAPFSIA